MYVGTASLQDVSGFIPLPDYQHTYFERGKTMKLNVYKTQTEIEKTYEIDNYDLMYGTVEDVLSIFDDIEDYSDNAQIFKVIQKNRTKLNDLMKDVFPDLTDDELRRIKVKELIPVFIELFNYVQKSFGIEKN